MISSPSSSSFHRHLSCYRHLFSYRYYHRYRFYRRRRWRHHHYSLSLLPTRQTRRLLILHSNPHNYNRASSPFLACDISPRVQPRFSVVPERPFLPPPRIRSLSSSVCSSSPSSPFCLSFCPSCLHHHYHHSYLLSCNLPTLSTLTRNSSHSVSNPHRRLLCYLFYPSLTRRCVLVLTRANVSSIHFYSGLDRYLLAILAFSRFACRTNEYLCLGIFDFEWRMKARSWSSS